MITKISDFIKKLREFGLEYFGRYYSFYRGFVHSVDDPENLGRIQVIVPEVFGKNPITKWAWPKGMMAGNGYGSFVIPKKGDPVYVSFEKGSTRFPVWEYGWYTKGNAPKNADTSSYSFETPSGHKIIFKEDGEVEIMHQNGFKVKLIEDGVFIGDGSSNLGMHLEEMKAQFQIAMCGPYALNNSSAFVQSLDKALKWIKKTE